jgi:D-amino-acid dehydrogenase
VSDPHLLTEALGQAALDRGARLVRRPARALLAQEGVAIETDDGASVSADRAVIAAGAWSRPFARAFGDRVPLDTERGYNTTLPSGTLGLSRPVMFEGEGFVTTPLDTGDRVGGAVEFAGLDGAPNFARIDAILSRLKRFLPEARLERHTAWMGFRPSIPDSLPVIGRSRGDARIVYAFGHGHHGLTQAAITAELVAALIDDREPPLALTPFSPQRF